MVDGRPPPLRPRRVQAAGAHRRRSLRGRLRPLHGCRHGAGHDGDRLRRQAPRGVDRARHVAHPEGSCGWQAADIARAARLCRSVRVRGPRGHRPVDGAVGSPVVGGGPEPLRGHLRADRPRRDAGRDHHAPRGHASRRGGRSSAPRQRPTDLDLRREPPRSPSRSRQGGELRRHPPRPPADARPQHHRGAHVPLPERQRALRPVRRVGHVCDRRGQHRESRLQHQYLRRRPLPPRVRRAWGPHGAARSEPSVDHPVEPRQRERLRIQPRCPRRVDAPCRPQPAAALRGWCDARRRHPPATVDAELDRWWDGGQ